MTPERRAEIEAALAAATPGVWQHLARIQPGTRQSWAVVTPEQNVAIMIVGSEEDMRLLGAAPGLIRELFADNDRLTAENERLQRALAAAAMAATDRERKP